ncbi:MAG: ribosome assembly cofactor RimP [Bacteroidota bacterium]|nr:ribosome assembly cofactor RimP [Bacteroidota bacterium]
MLDKNLIISTAEEFLKDRVDLFIVKAKVNKNNIVEIILDGDNGVKIEDCTNLSRFINKSFDRDKEDFELTVMSSGLGDYFSLPRQYKRNVGENIELIDKEGEKFSGTLAKVDDKGIVLTTKKEREGKEFLFENIEKARVIINFNKQK